MNCFKIYLRNAFASFFDGIPSYLLLSIGVVLIIGIIVSFLRIGGKKAGRLSAGILLVEYLVLILSSAVLFRETGIDRDCSFTPFASYALLFDRDKAVVVEIIINTLAFMPIGFLLGCAVKNMKWWKVAIFAFGFSLTIELLQLAFSKGITELDDVFHNTIGALIGYGIYSLSASLKRMVERIARKT